MIMKVGERVRKYEDSKTEFTLTVTEKSLKDIAAFVNTSGGTIYYGVDDSGKVIGLNDIDDQFTRLTNMIRDSISPDITLFMNAEIIEENNAKLIRVEVSSGAGKPYYLKSRGIRPDGVYVRQGSSSVPASAERIKAMIVETGGTGLMKIADSYKNSTVKHKLEVTEQAFKITLPFRPEVMNELK